MPVTTIGDQQWEFVGAHGVESPLGPEPDTTEGFPTQWRVFGPLGPDSTRVTENQTATLDVPTAEPLISADVAALREIPRELTIDVATFKAKNVRLKEGDMLDFASIFKINDKLPGYQAYAMAQVSFKQPTEVIFGIGCDWWMQLWIDGDELVNTLATGNSALKIAPSNNCLRHRFAAGKHLIVVRAISGSSGQWHLRAGYVDASQEALSNVRDDRWTVIPQMDLVLPPRRHAEPTLALRSDLYLEDETIECDFCLEVSEGQFGIVFGAQDASHYYWAYYPRWGQNWRARAFYAVIGIAQGHGHIRGLCMMLMPNVVTHWNATLNIKVERRGSHIQMYVNGVKGPFVIDDTYGPGRAGLAGFGKCRAEHVKIDGKRVTGQPWIADTPRAKAWANPVEDTGYGTIRGPWALCKLSDNEIVIGIHSRKGYFFGPEDPHATVNLYLSNDAGRTWSPHGDAQPTGSLANCHPWGIPWIVPEPGVIRAFEPEPAMIGGRDVLTAEDAQRAFTYRDSTDKGLTWSDPQPSALVGNWRRVLYRKGCWNHVYGYTRLRDGTMLALILHGYKDLFKRVINEGQGTWGTQMAQPFVSRSEDLGRTWQEPVAMDNAAFYEGEPPDSPCAGFSETAMAQLPSGRIISLCRPFRSPFSWQSQSDDGGRSWRLCCYTSFSVAGGPQMVATRSGYLAVVARQTGLGMHTSVDGGVNWDHGTLLDHDCWFNGFLTEAEPDVVLVFYFHPSADGVIPSMPRTQRIRITPHGPVPADA